MILVQTNLVEIPITQSQTFSNEQKKYARVKTAYQRKDTLIRNLLDSKGIESGYHIALVGFKKERLMQVWAKNKDQKFVLLKEYPFCASSGVLGPKRKEGDLQIPEGFYYLSKFNAVSSYHLALKVSYPNQSDKVLSDKKSPGSEIYIHGDCCTIGCIPLTDDKIEEVYVLAVEATTNGQQKIPIYIFPAKLDETGFAALQKEYAGNIPLLNFWSNLKTGYDYFMLYKKTPNITVDKAGVYSFK